jgi:hypothetical protein
MPSSYSRHDGGNIEKATAKIHPHSATIHQNHETKAGSPHYTDLTLQEVKIAGPARSPKLNETNPGAGSSENDDLPVLRQISHDSNKSCDSTSSTESSIPNGRKHVLQDSNTIQSENFHKLVRSPSSISAKKKFRSAARKASMVAMLKSFKRGRTRDRSLDDRVDQIEQKLAKHMYQTMGLQQAFEYYNKDGNSGLDRAELQELLVKCNAEFTTPELDRLMQRYDEDGNGTITLDEFITTVPISRERFLKFLEQKDEQRSACLDLPVTVLFFVWFVVLLSLHDVTASAFAVESGVMDDLVTRQSALYKDSFYTVDTIDKFWDWMETVLVPIAFQQNVVGMKDITLEEPHNWGLINSYNRFLGAGVAVQQTRSGHAACDILTVNSALNQSCHPWLKKGYVEMEQLDDPDAWSSNASFGTPLCSSLQLQFNCSDCSSFFDESDCYNDTMISSYVASVVSAFSVTDPELCSIEPYPSSDLPSFEVLLDAAQTQDDILSQIAYLRDRQWIDKSTKHIQLLFAVYNGEFGTYMAVNLLWEVNRGGAVIPSIRLQDSIPADPYDNNSFGLWLWEIGWIVMVLGQAFGEFKEMCEPRSTDETNEFKSNQRACNKGLKKYWSDIWNILDWIQIIFTLILMGIWYDICFNGVFPLTEEWSQTYNNSDLSIRQQAASSLIDVLHKAALYRNCVVINIIIILIRFFKAFLVQPRLSIVTKTFTKSFVDVVHFLIILLCLLFAFVCTGVFLLGHKIRDFSDIGEALMRLYQSMIALPLLKWDEVEVASKAADGYSMAMVWYSLFLLLINLVFKSMLLAIIMHAYAKARNDAGSKARTIWAQTEDVWTEIRAGWRGAMRLNNLISVMAVPADLDPNDIDESAMYCKATVNVHEVLLEYFKTQSLTLKDKKATLKQKNYWRKYAKTYLLRLWAEYFDFIDMKDPSDTEARQRQAFQRVRELDTDFQDLEGRIDRISSTMVANFQSMNTMMKKIHHELVVRNQQINSIDKEHHDIEAQITMI